MWCALPHGRSPEASTSPCLPLDPVPQRTSWAPSPSGHCHWTLRTIAHLLPFTVRLEFTSSSVLPVGSLKKDGFEDSQILASLCINYVTLGAREARELLWASVFLSIKWELEYSFPPPKLGIEEMSISKFLTQSMNNNMLPSMIIIFICHLPCPASMCFSKTH